MLALSASSVGCYVGLPDGAGVDAGTDGSVDSNDENDAPSGDSLSPEDDDGPSGGGGTSGAPDSGGTGDSAPSGDADGGAESSGGDAPTGGEPTGDDPDGPPQGAPLARGIAWDAVQINQGVAIDIVSDGAVVTPGQRNAALIARRPTLVRGRWRLQAGFEPRELEGRIIVDHGGSQDIYTDVVAVSGPPEASVVDGGFLWELPADAIDEGASLAFEIVETSQDAPSADATEGARVPADGFTSAGVASGVHELEVVVVPLRYVLGGGLTPDLSSANREILEQALYDQNPVTDLQISYRAQVDYDAAVQTGN